MEPEHRLKTLDEAVARLEALKGTKLVSELEWSPFKVLSHCAESIEYSTSEYPEYKPWLYRATVGKLALVVFKQRGYLNHSLLESVAGAPEIPDDGDNDEALDRLLTAIDKFQKYDGDVAEHFVFGTVTKPEYDYLHAMHIADHLLKLKSAST